MGDEHEKSLVYREREGEKERGHVKGAQDRMKS